jgi:hypothetical protein
MILRLLCIWLVFYSLLSSLMHGTMNLKIVTELLFLMQIPGRGVRSKILLTNNYSYECSSRLRKSL